MERIHGIVLRTVKYSDTRQIIDLFTLERGRMSCVKKLLKRDPAPLTHLDIICFDADIRPSQTLPPMQNIEKVHHFTSLRFDTMKTVMIMFLTEFLSNALREETVNSSLYRYIEDSLLWLDHAESGYASFHLVMMMHITQFMGITPNLDGYAPDRCFDLQNGCYVDKMVNGNYELFLLPTEAKTLPYLFHMNYENMHLCPMSRRQRQRCLDVLLTYYRLHIPAFRELRSLEVLKDIFN